MIHRKQWLFLFIEKLTDTLQNSLKYTYTAKKCDYAVVATITQKGVLMKPMIF